MTSRNLVRLAKQRVPWWAKLGIKIVLGRLPLSYRAWKYLGLFELGGMESPQYGFDAFRMHFAPSDLNRGTDPTTVLELGPGDSIFGGMTAHALGASKVFLVDVAQFAEISVASCTHMAQFLVTHGHPVSLPAPGASLEQLLSMYGITYLTDGLESLERIGDTSIDLVYSNAVLEHLPRSKFGTYLHNLRRILKPTGIASHAIDLQDHLGSGLNHLRFGEGFWESGLVRRAGIYTNRFRWPALRQQFASAGFSVEVLRMDRWDSLPLRREALHPSFRSVATDDLLVRWLIVRLRPV